MTQQPPVDYASPYGQPRTSGLAITSLVLGIVAIVTSCVGIGVLLGIAAVILGVIALGQMKEPGVGGRGMAIGGIVTGALAPLLIVPLLISILLPSLNRARETANRVKCASNMRQIALGGIIYGNEADDQIFPSDLHTILDTQDVTSAAFVCPSTDDVAAVDGVLTLDTSCSYVWLSDAAGVAPVPMTAGSDVPVAAEPLSNHNGDGSNVAWADGHVSFEQPASLRAILQDALANGRTDQATIDLIQDVP